MISYIGCLDSTFMVFKLFW